jgi:hypothetical protein
LGGKKEPLHIFAGSVSNWGRGGGESLEEDGEAGGEIESGTQEIEPFWSQTGACYVVERERKDLVGNLDLGGAFVATGMKISRDTVASRPPRPRRRKDGAKA